MKAKFNGILTLLIALSVQFVFAQKTVSGTVSDESGALPGASVMIKGTKIGTETDFDGKYSIQAKQGDVLVFSYVGLGTVEKTVGGANVIDVVMAASSENVLEEVVVTAIGISKSEKALGYNVEKIDGDDIYKKPNADVINSLAGTTTGVNIVSSAGDAGASTFMTIRGAKSITGNNQPLFVVNGMPIISGGGYSDVGGVNTSSRSIDINPNDIESISILKGGAATALYGVRAANGAVIITTKSGKNLDARRIEFQSSFGLEQISQVPEFQTKYAQGNDGNWIGGFARSWGPKIADLEYNGDPSYKWDPYGKLVPKGTGNGKPATAYNPYDFFRNGGIANNSLSISNGNEKGDYFFSASNLNHDGVIPNNKYMRTTLRINANSKLSSKSTLGVDMAFANSQAQQIQKGSNVSGIMLGLLRTSPTFDNSAGYEFADGTQRNYRNGGGYDNPYWTANNIVFDEDVNRLTSNLRYKVDITKHFNISYNGGLDWYSRRYNDNFKINSRANPTGYHGEYQSYSGIFNSDLLFNFSKNFSEKFESKLTIGQNAYSTFTKSLHADATGLEIPDFYHLSNSSNITTTSTESEYRTLAVFGDLQLSYDNMLFLGFTGRNDWSSTMPKANKSSFYPSVSLGFIFTELGNIKGDVLSYGKLRASAARTANIAQPYYTSSYFYKAATRDGWTTGVNFPYNGETGFALSTTLGNPDLKHETQDSWEAGVDLRFIKNRIGMEFTYFKNVNKDLLLAVPIAPSSGYSNMYANAATMEGKGIEISLNVNPFKTDTFNWDFVVNFTKMKNVVTDLAEGVENVFLGGFTVPQVRAVVGREYGSIYGFDWYRDSNGNVLINDDPNDNYRDGYPMADERQMVPIGDFNPDWTANITNNINYKNIGLSFLVDVKKGGMMYNGTGFAMNYFGTSKITENREVYYNSDGSINYNLTPAENIVVFDGVYGHVGSDGSPVATGVQNVTQVVQDEKWFEGQGSNFGGGPSIAAMQHADWIRLRDITLSYDIPKINNWIKESQIYLSGKNLLLFTPYKGVDPETNLEGSTNGQGMDYFNNPGTKSYTLGFKVTF